MELKWSTREHDWKVETDDLNVTLTRRVKGKKVYQVLGYYSNLENLVRSGLPQHGFQGIPGTLDEALTAWRELRESFLAAFKAVQSLQETSARPRKRERVKL